MTKADAVRFLCEAADYFEHRSTGGEDRAFWSNVMNAENCRKIAAMLEEPMPAPIFRCSKCWQIPCECSHNRTVWMLLKEHGGAAIINKETKESYPGDGHAMIEVTEQAESGATIMRILDANT